MIKIDSLCTNKLVPWTVIKQDQIKNTIWEKIDDTKKKLDFKELESIFASKPPATANSNVIDFVSIIDLGI